jgi:hypothetical protein
MSMLCAVSLEPTPATTIARSPTWLATISMTLMLSSAVRVADSPVVPLTTMPSWEWASRWSATARTASSSTAPAGVIGVTIAVSTRPKMGLVMRSDYRWFRLSLGASGA